MSEFLGTTTYASGEKQYFTEADAFLKTLREELHDIGSFSFAYEIIYADANTVRAADDMIYDLYGENNPHAADYYQRDTRCSMGVEEKNELLNTALYEKMFAEQEYYRGWLVKQTPEEILHHSYEYTVREDILMSLENNDLESAQAAVLLQSRSPLKDVFVEFEKRETDYMDTVLECLTERADTVLARQAEERREMREAPLYPHSVLHAEEAGKLDAYMASCEVNIACRDAIENAIQTNYHDNRLDSTEAARSVIQKFGIDRTLYVLAITIREKDFDGRISHENKAWAKTVPVVENIDQWGQNRNQEFVVDQVNPGLIDLFAKAVRYEQRLRMPLTSDEIKKEAARLLTELQRFDEPNSPGKTHFMAQISPDFLVRGNSKDMEKLMNTLPFQAIAFTGLNDRKGHFAMIPKTENRRQALRELKPSVRSQLKAAPAEQAEKKAPAKKHKEPER